MRFVFCVGRDSCVYHQQNVTLSDCSTIHAALSDKEADLLNPSYTVVAHSLSLSHTHTNC